MRIVLQRVLQSEVKVKDVSVGKIDKGLLLLLGIEDGDNEDDANWLISKIVQLRIFGDEGGKMNLNINDIGGQILVISQFTLYASTKKGNRPSFIRAAKPDLAIALYEYFIKNLSIKVNVKTGIFGAEMEVFLINDGPVTILLDTKHKE